MTGARALDLRVAAISRVTNRATGLSAHPLSHEEVLEVGRLAADRMGRLLRGIAARLGGQAGAVPRPVPGPSGRAAEAPSSGETK